MTENIITERLWQVLEIDPAAGAIEFNNDWWSWGDIRHTIETISKLLTAAKIEDHAAVGVMLRNRPPQVGALLSVLAGNRCVVTINPLLPHKRLIEDVESLALPVLIADKDDWAVPGLREAAERHGTVAIELTGEKTNPARYRPGLDKLGPQSHRAPTPGTAVEMLTSGTTGKPKRVKLGYKNLVAAIDASAHYTKDDSGKLTLKRSATLLYTPLVHISGMYFAIFSIFEGRPMVLLERFDPHKWTTAVKEHRLKTAGLVPTAMRMLLDSDVEREDLKSLIVVRSGTAPLDPDTADEFMERFGIPVLTTYGATEFAGAVAGWTLEDHKKYWTTKRGSSGRAHQGCELRVVDRDTGKILGPNAIGLLEVKADQVGPDWVRTADLALIDEDGFLFVKGRADNAIIRGGFKIMAGDVADTLKQHPAIGDAGVVGIKDTRLGEVPVAALELRPGAVAPTDEALKEFCKERLKPYEIPTRFLIVDKLPRTPSLKISQLEVKDLFEAD